MPQEAWGGEISAARNIGIRSSSAPLIMFVDGDDFIESQFCERLYHAMEDSRADIAICGTRCIYESNYLLRKSDSDYFKIKFDGLRPMDDRIQWTTNACLWNKVFRREIMFSHDVWFPEGLEHEDEYFFRVYSCWAKNIFFIPEQLYNYRRRNGGFMNRTANEANLGIHFVRIAVAVHEYLKENGLFDVKRDHIAWWFFTMLDLSIRCEKTEVGCANIYRFAVDFVKKEKWRAEDFHPCLRNSFDMLVNKSDN